MGDWVLYVDADERVLKPLREEIGGLMEEGNKSAYAIARNNIIFGQEVSYGPYLTSLPRIIFLRLTA